MKIKLKFKCYICGIEYNTETNFPDDWFASYNLIYDRHAFCSLHRPDYFSGPNPTAIIFKKEGDCEDNTMSK